MRKSLPSFLIIYSGDNYTGLCTELLVVHLETLMHFFKDMVYFMGPFIGKFQLIGFIYLLIEQYFCQVGERAAQLG